MSETAPPPAIDAILLAAGAGRRLGYPKALLEVHGRWMLPRIVDSLRAGGCRSVVVVTRPELLADIAKRGGCGADEMVLNAQADQGRSGSIQRGLDAVLAVVRQPEAVVIHPCDIPLLSADAVRQLLVHWLQAPKRESLVARLVTPGNRGGHPLLLGAGRYAEVQALEPDQPLRDVVHQDPSRRLDVARKSDPGPFLDVDTPEQLQLLESLLPPAPKV